MPRLGPALNLGAAVLVSAALLYAAFFGAGPLPALGLVFNPVTGAWTMAADASSNGAQTLHLNGLTQPARVVLERDGTAHVMAATDHDMFSRWATCTPSSASSRWTCCAARARAASRRSWARPRWTATGSSCSSDC